MAIMASLHCVCVSDHASVAGHPILGKLAGHRKTGASRGRPKTGCGLLSMRPRLQRQPTCRQSIRRRPLQWVIVALVKALNVVAVEALVTDLHPSAQRAPPEVPRRRTGSPPLRLQSDDSAAVVVAALRLAQNEEPAQPERIEESSCLPWGNASRLNARIASNRTGRRHFSA